MTIRDNRDYIRVLLNSYYTTMTGWGVLLNDNDSSNNINANSNNSINNDHNVALLILTMRGTGGEAI